LSEDEDMLSNAGETSARRPENGYTRFNCKSI